MKNVCKKQKGFTLIELMVSLGMLAFIFLTVVTVLKYQTKLLNATQIDTDLQQTARVVLNRTVDMVRKEPYVFVEDSALIGVYEEKKEYLIDFNGDSRRGKFNYIKDDKHGIIVDEKNNVIAENIEDFQIEILREDLIRITIVCKDKIKNKKFKVSTLLNTNKI